MQAEAAVGKEKLRRAQELLKQAALSEEGAPDSLTGGSPDPLTGVSPDSLTGGSPDGAGAQPGTAQQASAAARGPQTGGDAHFLQQISAALRGQRSVWHRAQVALLSHFARHLRRQLAQERAAHATALQAALRREEALAQRFRESEKVPSSLCMLLNPLSLRHAHPMQVPFVYNVSEAAPWPTHRHLPSLTAIPRFDEGIF